MSAPIRFAQISDTHIRPDAIERSQVFVDHLAEIQAGGYDFVIHTGDLMDEPSAWAARAFKAIISQLRVPIYFVPGNHDVYNPPMGEIEAAVVGQTGSGFQPGGAVPGLVWAGLAHL